MEVNDNEKPNKIKKPKKSRYDNHNFRKRAPPKLPKREIDVYVNNHSKLQSQLSKCEKLFEEGHSEIVIHGLGAAISTAVNVALMLQEKLSHTVDIEVNTSTVELLDEFDPLDDNEEPFSQKRSNSAVHIRVSRKPNFL